MSGGAVGQIVAVVTAAGVGWLASLVTVRASKRKILSQAGKTDADALAVIQKSALELVAEFESDAKDARAEVRGLRADVCKLETECRQAIDEVRRLKAAILDPSATMVGLRDLVTRSTRNGTP